MVYMSIRAPVWGPGELWHWAARRCCRYRHPHTLDFVDITRTETPWYCNFRYLRKSVSSSEYTAVQSLLTLGYELVESSCARPGTSINSWCISERHAITWVAMPRRGRSPLSQSLGWWEKILVAECTVYRLAQITLAKCLCKTVEESVIHSDPSIAIWRAVAAHEEASLNRVEVAIGQWCLNVETVIICQGDIM